MITDLRPIVERILRQMVIAGLPVVMATSCADGRGTLEGSGGVAGTGIGGTNVAGNGGGPGGAGGAPNIGLQCQPFDSQCGFRVTNCGGAFGNIPVETKTIDFDPNDPRWSELYQGCMAEEPGLTCTGDCHGLCVATWKSGAGVASPGNYLRCTLGCGQPNVLTITHQNIVCGRRAGSPCLEEAPARSAAPLGQYLARSARLEAESVPAFRRVARTLTVHGAPTALIRSARVAMADEARHWRRTRDLARKHGADPVRPPMLAPEFASLTEMALDNLVEGCVRETFGALVAAHQAASAGDPEVRSLMIDIAKDELAHANLSWRIDTWVTAKLGRAFESQRQSTARVAIAELVAGLEGIQDDDGVLTDAGLPDQEASRALLGATWTHLWKDAFLPTT